MLDKEDLKNLERLIEDAVRLEGKGFFCVVGPTELLKESINELRMRFEEKRSISGGRVIDMQAIEPNDIDDLATTPPPVIYFSNLADDFTDKPAWEKIKIRRDDFINKVIVIFFLDKSQYCMMMDNYHSIGSLTTTTNYPLGSQRTLDDMGVEFLDKIDEVLKRIDEYERKLNELIRKPSPVSPSDFLLVLRRWNSFSPILAHRPSLSTEQPEDSVWRQIRRVIRGGGYFLDWKNFGIAIDPGHNFIENLYRTNHSIDEIDAIVITHDHLDHTADFEAILDILYQYEKRDNPQKVSIYLNPTTYEKYKGSLESNHSVEQVHRLDLNPAKHIIISKEKGINLFSIKAEHTELGGKKEAVSLRFQLSAGRKGKNVSVGFTSDTGWHKKLKAFFKDVDVLVPHIGSIKRYEIEKTQFYETHLGILGLFKILREIYDTGNRPTVIISEFGEELMELRDILGDELGQKFPGMKIFPSDIGHFVELNPGNIRVLCGKDCKCDAKNFFEHDGEIQLRCEKHKPALGTIGWKLDRQE